MIDNHLGRKDIDGYMASAMGYNSSSGQAFHGIENRYYTLGERVRNAVIVAVVIGAGAGYLVWEILHGAVHLS